MNEHSPLEEYRQDISRCVKCGSCNAVCPTYRHARDESYSARGRMALVKAMLEGRITTSAAYQDRLASCTTCLACEAACPSGVPVTRIIQLAREQAIAGTGPGIVKTVIAAVVQRPVLFHAGARFGKAMLHLQQGQGSRGKGQGTRLRNADCGLRNNEKPKKKNRGRVAFFPGCAIEHFQPEIGRAVVNVLAALGYETIIPRGLKCCGRPLLTLGDRKAAEKLAAHNTDIFSRVDADAIVTACASCGLTFKKEYPTLLRSGAKAPAVMDIHEFLVRALAGSELAPIRETVTWHDPCHLSRGQGLAKASRDVLKAIPGITFVEMRNADTCCGFGGLMRMSFRGLSDGIVEEKVKDIAASGASMVATGCPGCRMQIADALMRRGSEIEVVHTVQLLEQALGIADRELRIADCEAVGSGRK